MMLGFMAGRLTSGGTETVEVPKPFPVPVSNSPCDVKLPMILEDRSRQTYNLSSIKEVSISVPMIVSYWEETVTGKKNVDGSTKEVRHTGTKVVLATGDVYLFDLSADDVSTMKKMCGVKMVTVEDLKAYREKVKDLKNKKEKLATETSKTNTK